VPLHRRRAAAGEARLRPPGNLCGKLYLQPRAVAGLTTFSGS
jgi:hypothetical protein